MLLKIKTLDIEATDYPLVLMHKDDAKFLGVRRLGRVNIKLGDKEFVAVVDLTEKLVNKGEVGLYEYLCNKFDTKCGLNAEVTLASPPDSVHFIKKKLDGNTLAKDEINNIIEDTVENRLSDIELSAFVSAVYTRGLSNEEVINLINSMVNTGQTLNIKRKPIFDKHCIGGVPGNRTTMVVVPILGAAGLTIPKTSSRAISSAAGTTDTMEVLCDVSFHKNEIERIVDKIGCCIVWGGGVDLAIADDKLIKIRNPLGLDPESLLLASILAKKKASGSEKVVIDIPVGKNAKIKDANFARKLARNFITLGERLEMEIKCMITYGEKPIGKGIGPSLEAIDVLKVLSGDGPYDLREKSCEIAGLLFEMGGKAPRGRGKEIAEQMIDSGKALSKFRDIINEQGGNPKVKIEDLPIGSYNHTVKSEIEGRIDFMDTRMINMIARACGAPDDKGAGIFFHVEKGERVKKGQDLFTLYADKETKITNALEILDGSPIGVEKVIYDIVEGELSL
ncbi:MAG: AMP phosphorylase [Candidatus Methanofastidiosum methylothiophilum]|uniref:AMP phosphorylase n=1 Tax=Candidatus Methanofastidiosum methylothiophilum TaxID=1705564 RepID=A0A150IX21_9EURY|nr:MAG: AMP phosphorylase [Candidatus Methanofastidiosum methylthiophilus]NMC76242.1 AMP phosphorylase [Candidatus Methanofastidiosa archaeon]